MFDNYMITAARAMKKQKLHIALNLVGLTTGLAAFILMVLYIQAELGYDRHHPDHQNVYRVVSGFPDMNLGKDGGAIVTPVFNDFLPSQFGDKVQSVTQIGFATGWYILEKDNTPLNQMPLQWADERLFDFFAINMVAGDGRAALSQPNQMIISASTAQKLYGRTDVVGEILALRDRQMKIGGVFEDLPDNTHLKFSVLGSTATYKQLNAQLFESWTNIEFYTYVKTKPGVNIQDLSSQINQLWTERNDRFKVDVSFQPLVDIHLTSDLMWEMKTNGSIESLYLVGILALFILSVAGFNFINMSTARASLRAKEIGIRKTVGATKRDIVLQFLSEAVLLVALAGVLATVVAQLMLPWFNDFVGKNLSIDYLTYLPKLLVLVLVVGLLSGAYPAFYMSSYDTLKVMSGNLSRGRSNALFRKILVGAQASLAILLLIMSSVVYRQINHSLNLDMGYDKQNVVVVQNIETGLMRQKYDTLYNRLIADPRISSVTTASHVPTMSFSNIESLTIDGREVEALARVPGVGVNYDYNKTLDIEVVAGRDFGREFANDWVHEVGEQQYHLSLLINESAVKAAGWSSPEQAIGQIFKWRDYTGKIVGVIKDVQFMSDKDITTAFFVGLGYFTATEVLAVKVAGDDINGVTRFIENTFSDIYQTSYLDTRVLAQEYSNLYRKEDKQKALMIRFTLLTILITCIGLVGLAAYSAERRQKELAIRKVIGASRWQLVNMLCLEFVVLGLIATVIAWPVAYYFAGQWLEVFISRIGLDWTVFVGSSVATLALMWVTVALLSLKATSVRPVHALHRD